MCWSQRAFDFVHILKKLWYMWWSPQSCNFKDVCVLLCLKLNQPFEFCLQNIHTKFVTTRIYWEGTEAKIRESVTSISICSSTFLSTPSTLYLHRSSLRCNVPLFSFYYFTNFFTQRNTIVLLQFTWFTISHHIHKFQKAHKFHTFA